MTNHAQKLIEVTEKHTLRPQKGDRARVIIEVLNYLKENCTEYYGIPGFKIIKPIDLDYIILDLKEQLR